MVRLRKERKFTRLGAGDHDKTVCTGWSLGSGDIPSLSHHLGGPSGEAFAFVWPMCLQATLIK